MIVNSGSLEDNSVEEVVDIYEPEGDDLINGVTFVDLPDRKSKIKKTASTDYGKIAKAIGDIRAAGIKVSLVDINESKFGFSPDVKNNQIRFGLKGLLNVGDELVDKIIENRPYASPKDFYTRVSPTKQAMISLIKSGAFDNMYDRKFVMAWYIWETCDKKSRITLQNMPGLLKYNIVPSGPEFDSAKRVYEFNRYLKTCCKDKTDPLNYFLDQRSVNFLQEIEEENLINILYSELEYTNKQEHTMFIMNMKKWDKVYQTWMNTFRTWIGDNKETILTQLNQKIFMEDWNKYASGNLSSWEMEVMCFYYHDHELLNVNNDLYGFSNFFDLPEEPKIESIVYRKGNPIKLFKLTKICGTCIAKNKSKSIVTLLTPTGVVDVKFRKEYFSLFDKQISERGSDGKKHITERSWFNRGSMIVVNGMRSGDNFVSKKYASTVGHQLYKISQVLENGELTLLDSRGDTEKVEGEE